MLPFQLNEDDSAELRAIVKKLDHEISSLPGQTTVEAYGTAATALLASWSGLHKLLTSVKAPELRECPVCKHSGRLDAKLCGYCWQKLKPASAPQSSP